MNRLHTCSLVALVLMESLFNAHAAPPPLIPMARYSTMATGATAEQVDPLNTVVLIHLPQQVQTIGEAMKVLLLGSGYRLDPANQKQPIVQTLFAQSLPVVDRSMGPMTINQGISTLMGPAYEKRVDLITRFISFHLKLAYEAPTPSTPKKSRRAHAQHG